MEAENTKPLTVKRFIQEHPDTALDLATPVGQLRLTAEEVRAMMQGGMVRPRFGDSGYSLSGNIVLQQLVTDVRQNPKNPDHFSLTTKHPAQYFDPVMAL